VLDDGMIVESGTHTELINKKDGFYAKLHSFQAIWGTRVRDWGSGREGEF